MRNKQPTLTEFDADIAKAIAAELSRQENHIELIASENYASLNVLEAQGSVLTNKYAEGYAHKRYYGGCEHVDVVENLAIQRAQELFQADYVNVQPHSGSQANAAVMLALLSPGDTILGMSLSAGGHLTHGCGVNFSGKLYHAVEYGVDINTGLIDYEDVLAKARASRPKLIIAGFSAYSQTVDWARFRQIADEVGAYLMADIAHVAGLIATGLYPSPIAFADVVTTTTHKTLRGPRGGMILAKSAETWGKKLNSAVFPGTQGGPLMHVIAAKAVAFGEALRPEFKTYQQQVLNNAKAMTRTLRDRQYDIVANGTQNHLFLLDLTRFDITGKDADKALSCANITVNKNTVPNETRSPFITSGLRLGTPAITTRGFKEPEVIQISHWIADILDDINNHDIQARIQEKVIQLCADFPVYK
ncbi:MAG: serine hydroxymethyltransferase [Legionellaceae bacterium]|nr:serine hydroxymethyltransferase [Legionellaceae bacterium]HCA89208.1 serine hydroxymethyltransferase [Legionellales bacterium]|tara:strand:- start:354 stop:1607 length:1254 start_codon:yes stop_codon:yes gene_type:complete